MMQNSWMTDVKWAPSEEEAIFTLTTKMTTKLMHINLLTDELTEWTAEQAQIFQLAWSPDGKVIAFLSNRNGNPQVYQINKQLQIEQLTHVAQGIEQFYWSPCGTVLWLNVLGQETSMKWCCEEKKPLPFVLEHKILAISHAGQYIVTADRMNNSLYVVDIKTGESCCIDEARQNIEQVSFSFTDQYIAYVGQDDTFGQATFPGVYVYDTTSKITQHITEMLDAPVGDTTAKKVLIAPEIAWTETDAFYFQLSDMGDVRLYYADLYGSIFPASPEENCVISYNVDKSGNRSIMTVCDKKNKQQLIFFDITTGEQRTLFTLEHSDVNVMPKPIVIETISGDIHGWLWQAPVQYGKKSPLKMQLPARYEMATPTYEEQYQRELQQGISIISINPHGSYGYGQAFANEATLQSADVLSTVQFALKNWDWVNEEQLMVVGLEQVNHEWKNSLQLKELLNTNH